MENKDDRLNVCAYINRERERVNPKSPLFLSNFETEYILLYPSLLKCETWLEAKSFNAKWCILVNDLETGKLMEKIPIHRVFKHVYNGLIFGVTIRAFSI